MHRRMGNKKEINMKRKTIPIWFKVMVTVALAGTLPALAQESLFGTWKMNAAKSKYSPGPIPKSNIAKWESFDGGGELTVDVASAHREAQHLECSCQIHRQGQPV